MYLGGTSYIGTAELESVLYALYPAAWRKKPVFYVADFYKQWFIHVKYLLWYHFCKIGLMKPRFFTIRIAARSARVEWWGEEVGTSRSCFISLHGKPQNSLRNLQISRNFPFFFNFQVFRNFQVISDIFRFFRNFISFSGNFRF